MPSQPIRAPLATHTPVGKGARPSAGSGLRWLTPAGGGRQTAAPNRVTADLRGLPGGLRRVYNRGAGVGARRGAKRGGVPSSSGLEPPRPLVGALALLAGALLALGLANSPYAAAYHAFWQDPCDIAGGVGWTGQAVVDKGLMALFFLAVGLELKHELTQGVLRHPRAMALPVLAALGGMLAPILIYHLLNAQGAASAGWAIPMTTDIAFATAVLTLLGPRIPRRLLVFMLALAVVDDIGAIIVIAVYYTQTLHPLAFAGLAGVLGVLVLANLRHTQSVALYLVLGAFLWFAIWRTGIDPPLAGVLLAAAVPITGVTAHRPVVAARLARGLTPLVAYGVMPLFALANAGVNVSLANLTVRPAVTGGVFLGLLAGKTLGITVAAWLAVRARAARLPTGTSFRQLVGVAWLGGMGFTMALFINVLAFPAGPDRLAGKLGILLASPLAAVIGGIWLVRTRLRSPSVAA